MTITTSNSLNAQQSTPVTLLQDATHNQTSYVDVHILHPDVWNYFTEQPKSTETSFLQCDNNRTSDVVVGNDVKCGLPLQAKL